MGDLHVYEVFGMDEYLPKVPYNGNKGIIQSFINGFNAVLFPKVKIDLLDNKRKNAWLKFFNVARELILIDKKHDLVIKKMNWYVRKIMDEIAPDFISDDTLYWFEIERHNMIDIIISVRDNNNEFIKVYNINEFSKFKNISNYLQRDYSDKLLCYIFNLSELHNYYILGNDNKNLFHDTLGYYPDLRCAIHGKNCYATGYIDWN